MKKLIFATNNDHKLLEIRSLLNPLYEIRGLKEMDIHDISEITGLSEKEIRKLI